MIKQEWEFRDEDCRICGSREFKVLGFRGGDAHRDGVGEKCRIVKCRNCNTIFPDPMPYPAGEDVRYSDVKSYFDDVMRIEHDQRLRSGTDLLTKAEDILGSKGRFLDVGCGRGEIVKAAADLGWQAKGADISEAYVEYARRENGVDAYAGRLEELGFANGSFDFISLVEVIEHLYDPVQMVKELHRLLRMDGLLYLSTPNEESIYQTVGNFYYKSLGRDWVVNLCPTWNLFHIIGFSPRSLKYLLESNGFRIEKTVVYSGTLVVPRRDSIAGKIEGLGISAVEKLANLLGKSPYMYSWARRV